MKIKGTTQLVDLEQLVRCIVDANWKFSHIPIDQYVYKKRKERLVSEIIQQVVAPLIFHNKVVDDCNQVKQ
jgi:hypothetical protein